MKYLNILLLFLTVSSLAQSTYFNKIYGNATSNTFSRKVFETSDGNFVFVGNRSSASELAKILVTKVNSYGDTLWVFEYGDDEYQYLDADLVMVSDGFVALCSKTAVDEEEDGFFLLKIDVAGELLWTKMYNLSDRDGTRDLKTTKDGGFIITGFTRSYNPEDYAQVGVLKVDSEGNTMWHKSYGLFDAVEEGTKVIETQDGGYMVLGKRETDEDDGSPWLLQLDSLGNIVWEKVYETTYFSFASDIVQTDDGSFLITGYKAITLAGSIDAWLFKIDSVGNMLWEKMIGGITYEFFDAIKLLKNGNIGIAGSSRSHNPPTYKLQGWFLQLTMDGDSLSSQYYVPSGSLEEDDQENDRFVDLIETSDGGILFSGLTFHQGLPSAWLVKTDSLGNTCMLADCDNRVTGTANSSLSSSLQIYPNPTTGILHIPFLKNKQATTTVYDLTGLKLLTHELKQEDTSLHLSVPNGTYVVHFQIGEKWFYQKVVVY